MNGENNKNPKLASLRALIEQLELPKKGQAAVSIFRTDSDEAVEDVGKIYKCKAGGSVNGSRKIRPLSEEDEELFTEAEQFADAEQEICSESVKNGKGKRAYGKYRRNAAAKSEEPKERFTTANQVYEYALNLLTFRDYSKAEMLDKLIKKGAAENFAREAIIKLVEYNFLNEERYALRVYEMWLNKRVYGRMHLQAELKKRCLEQDAAAKVLDKFTSAIEEQRAEAAAELFLQQNRKKLQELQNLQKEDNDFAEEEEVVEPEAGDCKGCQYGKKGTKKASKWGSRWSCGRNNKAAARIVALNKIQAAAGRFMAARGFSARYMYILLSKLHIGNDM